MRLKNLSIGAGLVALALFSASAVAALPDPVTFAFAVERGDVKKVSAWFDEGLDPEAVGNQLGTGLMIAAWNGNIEMMKLFIDRGANPRRANRAGEQPLQLAAWNGHTEAVKWLLANGAALNRDGNYWGALHYAVFNGHAALAKLLIERGADINARSPNGSTPLMMAAREGRDDLAKELLAAGADVKAKNDWGDSALTLAMRYDHYQIGKLISSAEEFAEAVKAPKETFGEPVRSAAAPSEIEELLRKIREAEAAGQPTEELRAQLNDAVNRFRRNAMAQKASRQPMPLPYQPKSIVITAKRGKPGAERAQIVVDGKAVTPPAPFAVSVKPGKGGAINVGDTKSKAPTAGEVADLMRRIRLAEAQGQPATELRQELYEAVEKLKR
jgi:hypothetical protein